MKKIERLSKEAEDKFQKYIDKWVQIGTSTDTCDIIEAMNAVNELYSLSSLKSKPKYMVGPVNNPIEGGVAEKILQEFAKNNKSFSSASELNSLVMNEVDKRIKNKNLKGISIKNQIYGYHEYWLSFYDFFLNETKVKNLEIVKPLIRLSESVGWWTPLKDVVILQHRPLEIHRDNQGRLSNTKGPAFKFRGKGDHVNLYFVKGVRVNKKIVEKDFNISDIENEDNIEVRRIMIELFGHSEYLQASNAHEISTDEFGTLYRKEFDDDEPIYMVKVINSTPEPDGSYKNYYISIDPEQYAGRAGREPRAAIASTWRNNDGSLVFNKPEEYDCLIET